MIKGRKFYKKLYEAERSRADALESELFHETIVKSCEYCKHAERSKTYKNKRLCMKDNSPTTNRVTNVDFCCRGYEPNEL